MEDKTIDEHNSTQPTSASEWKSKSKGAGKLHPVDMPSGNTALLRRVGLDVLLRVGIIPNSLLGVMMKQVNKAQGKADLDQEELDTDLRSMLDDPEKINDIMTLVDKLAVFVVAEPKLTPAPERANQWSAESERDDSLLYVDEIDLEDKMFIFQWVMGGAEDAATFSAQLAEGVGSLGDGEAVGE